MSKFFIYFYHFAMLSFAFNTGVYIAASDLASSLFMALFFILMLTLRKRTMELFSND